MSVCAGYQTYSAGGQRLSPQQQQLNQQQMAFQTGTNTNSNPQLSPRQPQFPQGTQNSQQTQPNQPQNQQQQWNQAAINSRLSVQQQQNPMLNAQLQVSPNVTGGYTNAARQFQAGRQRSLASPSTGVVPVRQNSFSGPDTGFPGPASPSAQATYGTAGPGNGGGNASPGIFNNSQMRLQRQNSIPQGAQHLPG